MASTPKLYDPTDKSGPDFSTAQALEILGLRDPQTLWRLRRSGDGPPFRRLGRKHARVTYPRQSFWDWYNAHTFTSEDDADAAGCR